MENRSMCYLGSEGFDHSSTLTKQRHLDYLAASADGFFNVYL